MTVTILHVPSSLATGIGPEMAHEFSLGVLQQELPPLGPEPQGCKFAAVVPSPQVGDRACLQTERMRSSPGRTAQIGGVGGILRKVQVCASPLRFPLRSWVLPPLSCSELWRQLCLWFSELSQNPTNTPPVCLSYLELGFFHLPFHKILGRGSEQRILIVFFWNHTIKTAVCSAPRGVVQAPLSGGSLG